VIVNAVRCVAENRRRWVTDASSIAAYGRREAVLQVGNVRSDAVLTSIGEAFLAARSQPSESVVVDAVADGLTFRVGDTLSVAGESMRCVGLTRQLGEDGEWRTVPEFSTLAEQRRLRADRVVNRMVELNGGGSALTAPVRGESRTKVPTGRLREIESHRWSWYELEDVIEDRPWQTYVADRFMRLYEFRVDADWFEVVDDVPEPVATGNTVISFLVNGVEYDPSPAIVLGMTDGSGSADLWGNSQVVPGDRIQPVLRDNGGHINGSVSIRASEPV
jgi:hypothetical protein